MCIPDDSTDKQNTSGDFPVKLFVADPDNVETPHDRVWYRPDACKVRANKTFFKIDQRLKYPLYKAKYDENGVPEIISCTPIEPKPDLSNRRITAADVKFGVMDFSSLQVPEGYEAKMRLHDAVSNTLLIEGDLVENDCRKTIISMLDALDEWHVFVINVMNQIVFTTVEINDDIGLLDIGPYGFEKKSGQPFVEIAGERKYSALDKCEDFKTMEEEGMAAECETDVLFIKDVYYNHTYNGHAKNKKIADFLFRGLTAFVEEEADKATPECE